MSLGLYLALFAGVIAVDQLSKNWAVRALPVAGAPGGGGTAALMRTRAGSYERLGRRGAVAIWLLAGGAGAALCLSADGGAAAAIGGVAAWAGAASNLGEWWRHGGVVDWVRLWPRSLTNIADVALILGSAQLAASVALS
jgi:lipoprotein signal peptidase